jgi:hypothetical protein
MEEEEFRRYENDLYDKYERRNMARQTLVEQGYEYDTVWGKWFEQPVYKPGDKVLRITSNQSISSPIKKGGTFAVKSYSDVQHCATSGVSATGKFVYDERGAYVEIFRQRIKVVGSNTMYLSNNFKKVEKDNNMMMIEADRPTFVREFVDTTKDGSAVREYVGDWLEFKNLSAARNYCSEQISNSIRNTNTYRKFSITVENSIAQAKKPEIEFA